MSIAEVNRTDGGFSLSGDIRFSNVLSLRKKGCCLIDDSDALELKVDLSQVTSNDTSALSLLLRWLFYAEQKKKRICYSAIPDSLLNMAKVCGVTQLVSGNGNG